MANTSCLSAAIATLFFYSQMELVELGSGECVAAATAKVEIRRRLVACGFFLGKPRLVLLGGREAASEARGEGPCQFVREGGLLLLTLKLPASELSFYHEDAGRARTHAHTHTHARAQQQQQQ